MKRMLHRVLFFQCGQPGKSLFIATVLSTLGAGLALLVHWSMLGMWVPALWGTLKCGWMLTFTLLFATVWLATTVPLPTKLPKFTLSPGLRPWANAPALHLVGSGSSLRDFHALMENLTQAVAIFDEHGLQKVRLLSVLLCDAGFRQQIATRLRIKLAQDHLDWEVLDGGVRKNAFYDVTYWLRFVAWPKGRVALGKHADKPLDLDRFRQAGDKLMSWGTLSLKRRGSSLDSQPTLAHEHHARSDWPAQNRDDG